MEFNEIPARVKAGRGKFCSKSCYTESQKMRTEDKKPRNLIMRDHYNKKRFGGNKYKAFERDGHKCKICGSKKNIEIHHIDGTGYKTVGYYGKSNNKLNNLLTVCHSCHIGITNKERKSYMKI
jgi:5-methylcytosine-specific restriction endonuclease McrA